MYAINNLFNHRLNHYLLQNECSNNEIIVETFAVSLLYD